MKLKFDPSAALWASRQSQKTELTFAALVSAVKELEAAQNKVKNTVFLVHPSTLERFKAIDKSTGLEILSGIPVRRAYDPKIKGPQIVLLDFQEKNQIVEIDGDVLVRQGAVIVRPDPAPVTAIKPREVEEGK